MERGGGVPRAQITQQNRPLLKQWQTSLLLLYHPWPLCVCESRGWWVASQASRWGHSSQSRTVHLYDTGRSLAVVANHGENKNISFLSLWHWISIIFKIFGIGNPRLHSGRKFTRYQGLFTMWWASVWERQPGTETSHSWCGGGTNRKSRSAQWPSVWQEKVKEHNLPSAPATGDVNGITQSRARFRQHQVGTEGETKKAYPPCADGPYKKTLTRELRSVKLKIQRESTPIKKIVNRKKWILRSIHLCLWWKSRKNEHNKRSDSRTIGRGENGAGCEGSKINVVGGIRKYCKETKKAMAELKRVLQSGKQNGQYGQLIHCCAGPVYEKF